MMPEKTIPVKASSAADFVDAAHRAMGGKRLGVTDYDFPGPKWKAGTDKKLTEVKFGALTTQITRVVWSGAHGTQPDKDDKAAIKKLEGRIKEHENEHASNYEDAYKKLVKKYEKELVGKDPKEVKEATDAIREALYEECVKLHRTEGKLEIKMSGGKPTVVESAEGANGCKKR